MVGASAAYACALRGTIGEIVLIDSDEKAAWGQAADISDAMGIDDSVEVRVGDYSDITTDDIVVISAGVAQEADQSRLDLMVENAKIMREIVHQVVAGGAVPYLVIVSNPVDIMTYVALKESKLGKNRVFGTGTTLDTSRLKSYLASELGVNNREVDAYVLGEHGDSSFATIETAQIGEVSIGDYPGFRPEIIENIEQRIRDRAYQIIDSKKSTYFAIGFVIAKIVEALRQTSHTVLPVCSLVQGEYGLNDVVLGLPSIINENGVRILSGYRLTQREKDLLQQSAEIIRQNITKLDD